MLWPVSSGWAGLLCAVPGACFSHGSGAGGRVWVDPRYWGSAQWPGARREMSLRALLVTPQQTRVELPGQSVIKCLCISQGSSGCYDINLETSEGVSA